MSAIRAGRADDLVAVLAMNNAAVPAVNELASTDLEWFIDHGEVFWVVDAPSGPEAFLVGLGPGVGYDSHNYRWFSERYPDFVYVDRVVVVPDAWGRGHGRSLYDALADHGRARGAPILLAEVNLVPRNDRSLAFHERYGFGRVAERDATDGKRLAMLACPL